MQDFVNQIKFKNPFGLLHRFCFKKKPKNILRPLATRPICCKLTGSKKIIAFRQLGIVMGLTDRLQDERSPFSAVSHIDYSSRLQTINEESDPFMQQLLMAWKQKTGIGMLINTSFNRKDEPIVCSPSDAILFLSIQKWTFWY